MLIYTSFWFVLREWNLRKVWIYLRILASIRNNACLVYKRPSINLKRILDLLETNLTITVTVFTELISGHTIHS